MVLMKPKPIMPPLMELPLTAAGSVILSNHRRYVFACGRATISTVVYRSWSRRTGFSYSLVIFGTDCHASLSLHSVLVSNMTAKKKEGRYKNKYSHRHRLPQHGVRYNNMMISAGFGTLGQAGAVAAILRLGFDMGCAKCAVRHWVGGGRGAQHCRTHIMISVEPSRFVIDLNM